MRTEEGIDELAEGAAEGVREGGDRGGGDAAARREPEFAEVGGRGEDEGLSEADEDLAEHYDAVLRWGGTRAGVADPIAAQDEEGGGDEGEARAAGVESVNSWWGGGDEGEEEGRAEPIDYAGGGGEVGCCCVGDWGEGKPL